MSVPLPEKVGRKTCEGIVLLLVFVKQQYSTMAKNLQKFTGYVKKVKQIFKGSLAT